MPLIRRVPNPAHVHADLVKALQDEIRNPRESGQPRIEETEFPSSSIRVTVIWDKWHGIPDEVRPEVILSAYEAVKGKAYRDRITLAIGLTVPEARELGMLPYGLYLSPALRSGDPSMIEQCHRAMRAEGASDLFDSGGPELWLATEEEAEACKE